MTDKLSLDEMLQLGEKISEWNPYSKRDIHTSNDSVDESWTQSEWIEVFYEGTIEGIRLLVSQRHTINYSFHIPREHDSYKLSAVSGDINLGKYRDKDDSKIKEFYETVQQKHNQQEEKEKERIKKEQEEKTKEGVEHARNLLN